MKSDHRPWANSPQIMTLKVVTYFDIDQQKHWYLQWNSAPDIKATVLTGWVSSGL
jgi:hypothetical protein